MSAQWCAARLGVAKGWIVFSTPSIHLCPFIRQLGHLTLRFFFLLNIVPFFVCLFFVVSCRCGRGFVGQFLLYCSAFCWKVRCYSYGLACIFTWYFSISAYIILSLIYACNVWLYFVSGVSFPLSRALWGSRDWQWTVVVDGGHAGLDCKLKFCLELWNQRSSSPKLVRWVRWLIGKQVKGEELLWTSLNRFMVKLHMVLVIILWAWWWLVCSWLWDSLPQVLAWEALGSDLQTVPDPRVLADSRTVLRRVLRSLSRFQVLAPHSGTGKV